MKYQYVTDYNIYIILQYTTIYMFAFVLFLKYNYLYTQNINIMMCITIPDYMEIMR